ncbi:isopenicillin N synthase family oxygenase [Flavobacteriaceae bacterium]|jgi:isopenicillin N synthase-like dioxygenase|nr:isopenicillin N synthase family oxygenase [Flavobacteriaceae bacterium]MDC0110056.1 isopenicillin N synthase family oxygenase [bacterium]MDA9850558.1 isopenicillin N synthase family oxygenase [Flavobacteriaceae bacterium]MDB2365955.1 isopenicillin N synthase family oxygenase [Flavobacteriaceae bacterium]MDB3874220.1 isopenicillin N synthase family oxygenase [Flavobacteriaceae bacterium]|tara:strand:+ start:54 stop:1004 length:951 start_codon:yes stop_codon:yes gene_type:complete
MNKIPQVNLNDYLTGDPDSKKKFINDLGKGFSEIGFIALKGHLLNDTVKESLYGEVKNFFNLSNEIKSKYIISGLASQRGFTPFGKEHAKGRNVGDLKEFWHFGQYVKNEPELENKYPKNVMVDELEEFNSVGQKTYELLEETGRHVLGAIACYLNLDETYFDKHIFNGNSILRAIHYPPITQEPKKAERAAAHGDINLITLLMGAQGKGLQVLSNNGEWVDAIAEDDEIIVNIGDMLSRHTNNKLKSTIHRVINPPKDLWNSSRYSIPFFLHPRLEMPLNCLESCIDSDSPKKFDDITAGDFLYQRLVDLGLVKD